jgi:uncharacterized protein YyaL (SSP411 family)
MITGAIERVTDAVIEALARDEAPTAPAVRLLLRRYAVTGRDEIRGALEPALARAVENWTARPRGEHPGWLLLFAEAAAVSDDERLRSAAADLAGSLRESWGRESKVAAAAAGVDAWLRANDVLHDVEVTVDIVQAAIDELERVVGAAYRPGEGVSETATGHGTRGRLSDQSSAAAALLTAFECTSRLPYSMLAEELMQFARRTLWDGAEGGFFDGDSGAKPFALNCETASVLCRLALLHGSDDYQRAAVVASDADYRRDAERILRWLAPSAPELGLAGAVYGLAAGDWQSVL